MKWHIAFSKQANNFIIEHRLGEEVLILIKLAIRKLQAEEVSLDIKKLKGEWKGFYRVRKGKYRIIASFDFDIPGVFIEAVDWRGNIY